MTRLAHVIDAFGADFRAHYRDRLTADHLLLKFVPVLASALVKERALIPCPCCGAVMVIVRTRIPPTLAGGPVIPPVVRGAL